MHMRFVCSSLFAIALGLVSAQAAEHVRLVTDKSVYLAGEHVLCSVAVFDDDVLSDASAVSYVELVSSDGLAAETKVALIGGRGAGVMNLPAGIATGAYKIFAFTSSGSYAETSEILVFNTGSSAKVRGGVEICESPAPAPESHDIIPLGFTLALRRTEGEIEYLLGNDSGSDRWVAVSVTEEDGLAATEGTQIIRLSPGLPESEGEIIKARVFGKDARKVCSSPWLTAIISAPGSPADTYTGKIGEDGTIVFNTNNIYGDKDLVCEILGAEDYRFDCHFGPLSPFFVPDGLSFAKLQLSRSQKTALIARHKALQETKACLDTMYEFLPKRDNLLLCLQDMQSYNLDDYTRFPTVEDIILELIPNVVVRKVNGQKKIKLSLNDVGTKRRGDNVLVTLDGVPVTAHERLLSYDALALAEVQVYPYVYVMGNTIFNGVVNFITARHDMSALAFDDNVRIMDFRGCSYPVALRMRDGGGSQGGRTLIWEPLLKLGAGQTVSFKVQDSGQVLSVRIHDMN